MKSFEGIKQEFFDKLTLMSDLGGGYALVPLDDRHSGYIVDWRNDPNNLELFESGETISIESQIFFMSTYSKRNRVDIVLLSDDTPIGVFSIKNLDVEPEYGALIGDKSFRGKGLANNVKKSILEYWFNVIGRKEIFTKIRSRNDFLITSNLKFGFRVVREEGDITVLKLEKKRWNKEKY